MMLTDRVSRLLEEHGIMCRVLPHARAFTAQGIAEATHVPGRRLAKVIVLRHGSGGYFLAVVPAPEHIRLDLVHDVTGYDGLRLASEAEISKLFPDCEVGALPPFGQLYGLPTFLDPCLLDEPWVYFQAGSHRDLIGIRGEDFERLERSARLSGCMHEVRASRPLQYY
jgi:Ala-tRNA(Pro) deacylase